MKGYRPCSPWHTDRQPLPFGPTLLKPGGLRACDEISIHGFNGTKSRRSVFHAHFIDSIFLYIFKLSSSTNLNNETADDLLTIEEILDSLLREKVMAIGCHNFEDIFDSGDLVLT